MAAHKPVRTWPKYLLNVTPELRAQLTAEALETGVSIADNIRAVLCARYQLECPEGGRPYEPARDKGNPSLVIPVPPKLFLRMQREKKRRRVSMRALIVEALEAHYQEEAA